jgi:hypothetical protein
MRLPSPSASRKATQEKATYERGIAAVERKLDVVTWMVGFNLALSLGVLWTMFSARA